MSGVHDMGGQPAGPLHLEEHVPSAFDQRVDAMLRLLAHPARGHFTVDAMRRSIESLPPAEYDGLAYYERWLRAVASLAVERGLVDVRELEARVAALARSSAGHGDARAASGGSEAARPGRRGLGAGLAGDDGHADGGGRASAGLSHGGQG